MLSHSQSKLIRSLRIKKHRYAEGLFVVEGSKAVLEALQSSNHSIKMVVAHSAWFGAFNEEEIPENIRFPISPADMDKISAFDTPSEVLAVVQMPERTQIPLQFEGLWLAAESIRDPGNLGTMLRIAEWFGAKGLLLSPDCADVFNPKTVQASMGSIFRLPVFHCSLTEVLSNAASDVAFVAAAMEGNASPTFNFDFNTVLLLGNEGNGLSEELLALVPKRVNIPQWGGAESLNAAIASAVLAYQYRLQHP